MDAPKERLVYRWIPSLKKAQYRRYSMAQSLSVIGVWMQSVALYWMVYQLTGSPARLGIFAALGAIPLLILGPAAGMVADQTSRRNVMLLTQSLMTVLALALSILYAADLLTYTPALVITLLQGIVFAFDMPARHALVIDLIEGQDVGSAVALNSSIFNAARLIGPAVAGFVLIRWGAGWCFLFNAFSYLPVIVVLAFIPPRHPDTAAGRTKSFKRDLVEGFRYIQSEPFLKILLVMVGLMSIFGYSVNTILPVFAGSVFNQSADGYGKLVSAMGFGSLLGAINLLFFGSRQPVKRFFVLGLLATGAGFFVFSRLVSFQLSMVMIALAGWGLVVVNASSNTLIQTWVPDMLRGRIMGFYGIMFLGISPLGNLQMGFVAEHLSPRIAVAVSAAVCLTCAALAAVRIPGTLVQSGNTTAFPQRHVS